MKIVKQITLLATYLLISATTFGQNYPADPSLSTIISDLKKDKLVKELMTSYGYNPADVDKGTYRMAKKSELKDYFNTSWYDRSDVAYKVTLNQNYMDLRYFAVFLTTPKDANGVSHKIFFKVRYTRRTLQDFQDTKWNYELAILDPRENESYGLPKISDEKRKQLMMDYILENKDTDTELKQKHYITRKIIQIDSVLTYSNNVTYYKPLTATTFLWTLVIRGEYIEDTDSDGGVERTRQGYIRIPMTAVYQNGSYSIQHVNYDLDYLDNRAPGFQALYDAGLTNNNDLEDAVWYETLHEKGFDALMGKKYTKSQPVGSEAFVEKRMKEIEEALKVMDSGDHDKIKKALMPIMNPAKAKELTESYLELVQSFEAKLCTLEVYRTTGSIPYSYDVGDKDGPKVEFGMSVKRASARTKEQKKAYKEAGMSSAVLKSTARGSEYGLVTNSAYHVDFKLVLIGDNWYIDEVSNMDLVKVSF